MEKVNKNISDVQKNEIIKLFKQVLEEKPEFIKDKRSSSIKNTIDQSCFISEGLNGEYDGIFFPNASFEMFKDLEFVCLCLHDNKPSMCMKFVDTNKFHFEALEDILYSREEQEFRKKLIKSKKDYEQRFCLLSSIYRKTKKDGEDFKDLFKNFDSSMKYFKMAANIFSTRIDIYASDTKPNGMYERYEDTIYLIRGKTTSDLTASELMELIQQEIEKYKKYIKEKEQQLSCLHTEALKVEKIFQKLLDENNKLINKRYLKEYLESNSYKLH